MAMEFEQIWQERLQSSLERELGTEAARQLIAGLGPSDSTSASGWTRRTLAELRTLAGTQQCRLVLAGCACRYPAELLPPIRQAYAASGDLVWAHCMLQAQYLEFLRRDLALEAKVRRHCQGERLGPGRDAERQHGRSDQDAQERQPVGVLELHRSGPPPRALLPLSASPRCACTWRAHAAGLLLLRCRVLPGAVGGDPRPTGPCGSGHQCGGGG
jgi:hypothetical protein